jgi:hypothetical protein
MTNEGHTLEELRVGKKRLEAAIFQKLMDFEENYGVKINSLDLEWGLIMPTVTAEESNEIINVHVSVDI